MATARTIDRLTEDWPDEAGNFELQAFAASLHDERAELSAPALGRIESLLSRELDRRTDRPEQPPSRWQIARRSLGTFSRFIAPYAAAACLLIGGGVWIHQQMTGPRAGTPEQVPVEHRPKDLQPRTPDDSAALPRPAAPQGG
jgi:hypothetical protein